MAARPVLDVRAAPRRILRASGWLVLAAALSSALPGVARAWNESGHRIVARIAWDELTAAQQAFVVDLLVQHPRFDEDFVGRMPDAIQALPADGAERRRWIFMHAAIWPDLIKGEVKRLAKESAATTDVAARAEVERRLADVKRYDNSSWHYDNKPIYVDPYALPPAPAAGAQPVGVQVALPNALRELGDTRLSADRRAVALAWVVHLVGDSHQPLHSAALFSARHLPQGDLGGNRIVVTTGAATDAAPTSLHALWDDLLGDDPDSERATKGRVVAANPRRKLQRELAAIAAPGAEESMVNLWLDESYRTADTEVYDARMREALISAPPVGATSPMPLALDRRYLQRARSVGMRRVALAGYRLTDCIARAHGMSRP